MNIILITIALSAILSDGCKANNVPSPIQNHINALNAHLQPYQGQPLNVISREVSEWLKSKNSVSNGNRQIEQFNEALSGLDILMTSSNCGLEGESKTKPLHQLYMRLDINSRRSLRLIRDLRQERARNCHAVDLAELKKRESSVDEDHLRNIREMSDYLQEILAEEDTKVEDLIMHQPEAARIAIAQRLDDTDSKIILIGEEPVHESKVFDLYKKYIFTPCRLYVEAMRSIMQAVEYDGQLDFAYTKINDFTPYVLRYRTCEIISTRQMSGKSYKEFREQVKRASGKYVIESIWSMMFGKKKEDKLFSR